MEKPHELLKNLVEAMDAFNEKFDVAAMSEDALKVEEGKNWQRAYWEAKEFLNQKEVPAE